MTMTEWAKPMPDQRDHFLQHPPFQPKREIGNYVEQHGILVPKRYTSLEEAKAEIHSGTSIIVRSEHPHEYNGMAGLLHSRRIDLEEIQKATSFLRQVQPPEGRHPAKHAKARFLTAEETELWQLFSATDIWDDDRVAYYCRLMGFDEATFKQDISYSYWERIPGDNHTVVADTAIAGRYHIYSTDDAGTFRAYKIVSPDGTIQNFGGTKNVPIHTLIEQYDTVKTLPEFDPQHCPIMEFQSNGGDMYFLQYHRTRDFTESSFGITSWPDNAIPGIVIRGATPQEGIIVPIQSYFPIEWGEFTQEHMHESGLLFAQTEEGRMDEIAIEVVSRKLQALVASRSWKMLTNDLACGHFGKSMMHNPAVSIAIDERHIAHLLGRDNMQTLQVRVVSDGQSGYIQIIK